MKPNDNFVAFLGFAPDADPTTPGVLTDTTMMISGVRGLASFPLGTRLDGPTGLATNANFSIYPQGVAETMWVGLDPDSATTMGIVVKTRKDLTNRLYALRSLTTNTSAVVYGQWQDVAPTSVSMVNGPYTFARMGGTLLFCGGYTSGTSGTPKQKLSSLNWDASVQVTAAPFASIVVVANRFTMVLNYNTTAAGHAPGVGFTDGWYCAGRDNFTDWTASVSTLCAYGRLVESDGQLTAGLAFGDDILAFKQNSFYLGRFVPDNAEVWVWEKVSSSAGARNQMCVCNDREGRAYMLALDDLYVWDGAQVKGLMGGKVREWYVANFYNVDITTSPVRTLPSIFYDSLREAIIVCGQASGDSGNYVLSLCLRTGIWAKAFTQYDFVCAGGGIRIASSVNISWPNYSTPYGLKSSTTFSYNDSSANRYLFDLNSQATAGGQVCGFTTGDYGSDFFESEVKALRARDIAGNSLVQSNRRARAYHRPALTDALSASSWVTAKADGAFDIRQSDKWHRFAFEYSGHAEVTGVNIDVTRQGAK